ncbi:hypothetical protein ACFFIS_07740 [Virgibacillus soli]|uniref:Uncharacterized protein n=1 Tax=Paracerasibacillus soli TaxID=480284 RepID=A0ABU5CN99_9BACI|nr:hypothetical protein [Virgibacillus soli]MDY0407841.1 hypothetical protein [Virgibacillus soli]
MRYLAEKELNLASRFLFLSMAIVVLKQDLLLIQKGNFKIKQPYLNLIEQMITLALTERRQLRKQMEDLQLKVILLNKNDSVSSYLFICRGREEQRNYFNPAIRNKVEALLQELMCKIPQPYSTHVSASF